MFEKKARDLITSKKENNEAVRCSEYTIDSASFKRLRPGCWLNDEIINAYTHLINKQLANSTNKNMLCLNSFFLTMLEDMQA